MLNENTVLAINLRPDQTQVVYGKINKNQLHIFSCNHTNSIFSVLNTFNQQNVSLFLASLLERIKYKKVDACYIGIASELIKSIVFKEREYVPKEEWNTVIPAWMAKEMDIDKNDFYISTPITIQRHNKMIVSGVAIRTTYIDLLYNAAACVNLPLRSIEPTSFAFMRFLSDWQSESFIFEITENNTYCISYSPIRGLFKSSYSAGWDDFIKQDSASGLEELEQCISTFDYSAYNTYDRANNNIPIYILSTRSDQIYALAKKSAKLGERFQPYPTSSFVKNDTQEIQEYTASFGLALTSLHERMIDYADR